MRKKKNALGYTYLAPALISILLVTCLPIIYTVILSFTNYNMYHLTDYTFVGLENYLTVFSGSIKNVFFPVLGWTICFALLSTAGSYAMGLILAILLNNPHMKESKILCIGCSFFMNSIDKKTWYVYNKNMQRKLGVEVIL